MRKIGPERVCVWDMWSDCAAARCLLMPELEIYSTSDPPPSAVRMCLSDLVGTLGFAEAMAYIWIPTLPRKTADSTLLNLA